MKNGTEPGREWLRGLARKDRVEIGADIAEGRIGACSFTSEGVGAMKKSRIGSSFGNYLDEEGVREEVEVLAQKRVIAWQIEQAMKARGLTKVEMAERMQTSRTQIDRLLDPNNNKVQLDTLQRAAQAVGRRLKVDLV